jgi:hypothetical protein
MAWSQSDIDALKAAIATGTRSVSYSDRAVTYHSMDDMLKALQAMEAEVAGTQATGGTRSTFASFARD